MTSTSHPQVSTSVLRLQWARRFPGTAAGAAAARHWIQRLLPPSEAQDDLISIAGELTANAVTHTRSGHPDGTFGVEVSWNPELIRLTVTDQGAPSPPRLITDSVGAGGRGLFLVSQLASQWGVVGDQETRRVWAELQPDQVRDPVPAVLAVIEHQHPGSTAWYGEITGQWWAVDERRLISADSPSQLTTALNRGAVDLSTK